MKINAFRIAIVMEILSATACTGTPEVVAPPGVVLSLLAQTVTVAEDGQAAAMVTINGDDKVVSEAEVIVDTQPAHGTLEQELKQILYTPEPNYNGPDSFTAHAVSGEHTSDVVTIAITVTPVNDAPIAEESELLTNEDTPLNGTVTASDIDGDPISFVVATAPAHGTLSFNAFTGTYTYQPDTNYTGGDSFSVLADDGAITSDPAIISITVIPVNHVPQAITKAIAIYEDSITADTVGFVNVDADDLIFSVVTPQQHGELLLNASTGVYSYSPAANFNGEDHFSFSVDDGFFAPVTADVFITVNAVNDIPIAYATFVTTSEDIGYGGSVTGSDVEGSTLLYAVSATTANGTVVINPGTGAFYYSPATNFNGVDSFYYTVNDGALTSSAKKVAITVTSVNDVPVADDHSYTLDEDTVLSGTLSASDADAGALSFTVALAPAHGALSITASTGQFTYTPDTNFNGTDSFTFTASDGSDSDTATISLTINSVYDNPVVPPVQVFHTALNTPVTFTLQATLIEGGTASFNEISPFTHGTGTVSSSGSMTYAPASATFSGVDYYTFSVSDGQGGFTTDRQVLIWIDSCDHDADGDGYGSDCPSGLDADDNDPSVYPGAPELPDDGIDQDGSGDDLSVLDGGGIYVDMASGDNANDGSMAYPVSTITHALSIAADGQPLFIAQGMYDYGVTEYTLSKHGLYGGYGPGWIRDLGAGLYPTIITSSIHVKITATGDTYPVVFQGITLYGAIQMYNLHGVIADSNFFSKADPNSGCCVGVLNLAPPNGFHAVIRNNFRSSSSTGIPIFMRGARANMTHNKVFVNGPSPAEEAGSPIAFYLEDNTYTVDSNWVRVYGYSGAAGIRNTGGALQARNNVVETSAENNIYGVLGIGVVDPTSGKSNFINNTVIHGIFGGDSTGTFQMANNIVINDPYAIAISNRSVIPKYNDLIGTFALNHWFLDVTIASVEDLNACTFSFCSLAEGNISADPMFDPGTFVPLPGSPVINAGIDPATLLGAPSVSVDINGVSRGTGGFWDMGAYEQ